MMQSLQSLRWTTRLRFLQKSSFIRQGRHISRGISISCSPAKNSNPRVLLRRTQYLDSFPHQTCSKSINLFNSIPKRFASTKLDTPQNIIDPSSTADAAPLSDFTSSFTSSSLDDIPTKIDPQAIGEHLGFLKQLGLDFGWGPTAVYETVLESVYLITGTPWWGSILLTVLLFRGVFLPLFIRAADSAARIAAIKHLADPLHARIRIAKATQDIEEVRFATRDLQQLYGAAGIKMTAMFIPVAGQGLIGYGSFRLLRNMATLPVPGLDESGLLWFKDLTISDPYFILPMATGALLHLTFKLGGETGGTQTMNPTVRKFMTYVLPVISVGCTSFLPASVQLSFVFSAVLALLQSYYLRQSWVRELLRIQPLPSTQDTLSQTPYKGTMTIQPSPMSVMEPPPAPKGIIGGAISDIKGAASQVMNQAREFQQGQGEKMGNQRLTKAELKRAQAYEAQRQREIAQEKLDAENAPVQRRRRSA